MNPLHFQQRPLNQQWPTTASNGWKNGSATGATSAFNGFSMGTRWKPVPLPFHCRWGIFGGWNISDPHQGRIPPPGQSRHYNVLCTPYCKTSEQRQRSSTRGWGALHTRSNSTLQQAMHDLLQNIRATRNVIHTRVGYPPPLGQTHQWNVLRVTCCKKSKQALKVIHIGIGYPPHSVKLNTVMCCVQIATKHLSKDGKSSISGLGAPHTQSNSTL